VPHFDRVRYSLLPTNAAAWLVQICPILSKTSSSQCTLENNLQEILLYYVLMACTWFGLASHELDMYSIR
jgi:hypothetical protein